MRYKNHIILDANRSLTTKLYWEYVHNTVYGPANTSVVALIANKGNAFQKDTKDCFIKYLMFYNEKDQFPSLFKERSFANTKNSGIVQEKVGVFI